MVTAVVLFSLPWASTAQTHPIAVEGYFESIFMPGASQRLERAARFRVELLPDTLTWCIKDLTTPPRAVAASNGQVVNRSDAIGSKTPRIELSLLHEGYPVDADWDQRMLWFTYCARNVVRHKEGGAFIVPDGDPRRDPELLGCRLVANWRNQSDLCPELARFLFDGGILGSALTLMTLEPEGAYLNKRQVTVRHYLKSFTNNTLVAQFSVLAWTNYAGISAPLQWRFEEYRFGIVTRRCVGRTESVGFAGLVEVVAVPQQTDVMDMRLRDPQLGVNSISYTISDGRIPELTDTQLRRRVAAEAAPSNRVLPKDVRTQRIIFTALVVAVFALPLAYRLLRRSAAFSSYLGAMTSKTPLSPENHH